MWRVVAVGPIWKKKSDDWLRILMIFSARSKFKF